MNGILQVNFKKNALMTFALNCSLPFLYLPARQCHSESA
jgi:hypothetical protein